jgi:hypothetical protein
MLKHVLIEGRRTTGKYAGNTPLPNLPSDLSTTDKTTIATFANDTAILSTNKGHCMENHYKSSNICPDNIHHQENSMSPSLCPEQADPYAVRGKIPGTPLG